jgi:hypothetical protein
VLVHYLEIERYLRHLRHLRLGPMPDGPTYVFVGPTIRPAEAQAILPDAMYLPPVAQGDVYRAARHRPRAIGIIDGFFDQVPAVWHKEILFALDRGIAVFGAASMGALRAAELDVFGMIGVGEIYAAYRDGVLEDDDEVAIAHATAEGGFRELSDAMVNVRATLRAAEHEAVIRPATGTMVERAAKELFYPDRTFVAALAGAEAMGADRLELEAFRTWLPTGKINAKREDAIEMLTRMHEGSPREPSRFQFEHTVFFADLVASAPWDDSDVAELEPGHRGVLDEVRLQPDVWHQTLHGATLRALADRDADARGLSVSNEALVDATVTFRRERDLHDSPELVAWMESNDLDGRAFVELMENQTRLAWLLRANHDEALARVPDELRASGRLRALRVRAQEKSHWIDTQGLEMMSLEDLGLREADIFAWYFGRCLKRAVPADIWAYAQAVGFADVEQFRRAVTREYMFATREPRVNGE